MVDSTRPCGRLLAEKETAQSRTEQTFRAAYRFRRRAIKANEKLSVPDCWSGPAIGSFNSLANLRTDSTQSDKRKQFQYFSPSVATCLQQQGSSLCMRDPCGHRVFCC